GRAVLSDPAASLPGMTIPARISIVTLGVRDLATSIAFYQALGWRKSTASNDQIAWFVTADSALGWRKSTASNDQIAWFVTAHSALGLFPQAELAADAGVPTGEPGRAGEPDGFRGMTLAINLGSPAEVDAAMAAAQAAGATVVTPPQKVFWGGYRGYFA